MKIFTAIVSLSISVYLFIEAHDMAGISLERMGYLVAAVSLLVFAIFIFVPAKNDEQK